MVALWYCQVPVIISSFSAYEFHSQGHLIACFIIYLFNQYLLNPYSVAGTVLGPGSVLDRVATKYLAEVTFE